jgi:hypothetical protein
MKAQALRNLILYFLFLLSLIACENNKNEITLAIENATVITLKGEEVLEGYTLLISGETIVDIIPVKQWKNGHNIETIDATGKFIIPALTDMHVHYVPANDDILPMFMEYGVTALRFMAGSEDLLRFRDSIKHHQLQLPEFYVASQLIDGDPPVWGDQHNGPILTSKEAVEDVITIQTELGYDFLKLYSSLNPELFNELIKIAAKRGIKVTGHVPVGLKSENLYPVDFEIQHLSGYPRFVSEVDTLREKIGDYDIRVDKIAAMQVSDFKMAEAACISKQNNNWNCPTLVLFFNRSNTEVCESISTDSDLEKLGGLVHWWKSIGCGTDTETQNLSAFQHQMVAALHLEGNKLLAGTDFPNPWIIPGKSLHQELERFVAAGLSNYEAIKTATVNPAEWLGTLDKKGTLQPGMAADMILLHKNPLEDISNTQSIYRVIFKGKILNQPVE